MDSIQEPAIQQGLLLLDSFTKEHIYRIYYHTVHKQVMADLLASTLMTPDTEDYSIIHDHVRAVFRSVRFNPLPLDYTPDEDELDLDVEFIYEEQDDGMMYNLEFPEPDFEIPVGA